MSAEGLGFHKLIRQKKSTLPKFAFRLTCTPKKLDQTSIRQGRLTAMKRVSENEDAGQLPQTFSQFRRKVLHCF